MKPVTRSAKASTPKAPPRKSARRSNGAAVGATFSDFAKAALARGEPDAVPDLELQNVLAAAVRVYAAKVEQRGEVKPLGDNAVTATEVIVTACGLVRAADLNPFDVAMWFHRMPIR